MKHLSISLRLLAIATVFMVSSCKKDSSNMCTEAKDNTVVLNSRTINPGQFARVTLSQQAVLRLQAGERLTLQQNGINDFVASKGTGTVEANVLVGGNCPPISAATMAYYQAQANSCCCSFVVCLQAGPGCLFYLIYFSPNNGCTGGGGGELM
jgi:hypothetical protein